MQRPFHILAILFICSVALQSKDIVRPPVESATGDTILVPVRQVETTIAAYLADLKEQGYWNAQIEILTESSDSLHVKALIKQGGVTAIDFVHFKEAIARELPYLQREYFLGQAGITPTDIMRAEGRLRDRGYYLKRLGDVSKDGEGRYHLSYRLVKRPELSIDALAAFNQSAGSDTLAFYGHIYLYVPNLDGNGKSIRLNWKRLKPNSELFFLSYEHPWLFNMPFKADIGFGREVIDGNYQILETRIGVEWTMDWERSMIFQFEDQQSLITYAGSLLNPEWRSSRKQLLGLGYRHGNLDQIAHQGFALRAMLFQELKFEPSSVSRLDVRSEAELSLRSNIFISQRNALSIQNRVNTDEDPSLLKPLGGVGSVRGYEENQIRSLSVASFQHDLYLLIGEQSRLMALADAGLYMKDNAVEVLMGYGVGVQLNSGRGPIRIILATHRGLGLQNSFLHIEYSGGISWIDR